MADLTTSEQEKVRLYLGFRRGRDLYPELESQFTGYLTDEEVAEVRDVLSKLAAIETQIATSSPVSSANTANGNIREVIGEVAFFDAGNNMMVLDMIAREGSRLIQHLVILFGVEPKRDYFGSSAPSGGMLSVG